MTYRTSSTTGNRMKNNKKAPDRVLFLLCDFAGKTVRYAFFGAILDI